MFKKDYRKKLERAEYCLDNLKILATESGGFSAIPQDKQQAMRANLDCFFFELISAKDFFLQEINDHYELGMQKKDATSIDQLKKCLSCRNEPKALDVVISIEKEIISNKNTWQWRINNYRNSTTHRELLHMGHEVNMSTGGDVRTYLFKDPEDSKQRNLDIEVLPYCEESLKNMKEWLESLYSQLGIPENEPQEG